MRDEPALAQTLAGMVVGQALRQRMSVETFRMVFFAGLLALGVYLAWGVVAVDLSVGSATAPAGRTGKWQTDKMSLYVLKLVACADGHQQYIDGERRALLVFANTDSLESALCSTPTHLVTCGWQHVEVRDAKTLAVEVSSIGDDVLRNAAEAALQDGYAIVIYATPITDLNS
ncbi:hypothetical protein [Mesorhizobium sangaii]|uniref:Uncharacterized protein n=1 Tax=Mesorhizobium sangaii TaxID=505389 RepID=A0A841PQS2_9HYPH|nr:hypothetical protein [Mesorhizobium sangaii]MBB6412489.1 hypothetical protein [Mesorhizobium sangaii]